MPTELNIGVDIGNYDTKTQGTITPSSFSKYKTEPLMAGEVLTFNGSYYITTTARDNQEKDKTKDDYALIMTLFAIAKEIIHQVHNPSSANDLQKEVDEVTSIRLAEGLPVGYFSELSKPTANYFKEVFKNGVSFAYKGDSTKMKNIIFNLKVSHVGIYPQDITGVAQNPNLSVPSSFDDYYIIGMGGGTVDIIPMENKLPQVPKCVSLTKGTTEMYKAISTYLQQNGYGAKDYQLIEKIIAGKNTIVPAEEKNIINECVENYADKLVEDLTHRGLKLCDYPTVFIGGGALLLKPYLTKNPAFRKIEFVENVNANAYYYARAI